MRQLVRLMLMAFCLTLSPAQGQMGQTDLPSVGESSVVIVNKGNITVTFSLRPLDGVWSEYDLASGKNTKISCDQCSTPSFEIYISTTGGGVSNYTLPSEGRFSIEWSEAADKWDVFNLQ
jgi:hypothetical protein